MNWEIGIDTYTLLILCIKYITIENILYVCSAAQSRNYTAPLAIVKQMTGRNRAAQLAIVKQMSRH